MMQEGEPGGRGTPQPQTSAPILPASPPRELPACKHFTDTWHSVLSPQQAGSSETVGGARFYTFPTSASQVRNFRKQGD